MTAMGKPNVFISYSRRDVDWARSFAQALKQRGVIVWFDEFDVQPGESVRDALESALRNSDVLVALLDAEYPSKPAVFFELGAAIGMGKKVCRNCSEGPGSGSPPIGPPLTAVPGSR